MTPSFYYRSENNDNFCRRNHIYTGKHFKLNAIKKETILDHKVSYEKWRDIK